VTGASMLKSSFIKKIYVDLKSNSFITNTLTLVSGSVISQAILVLISPLLSRLYSVEEFGVYALYLSILCIIVSFSTLKFDFAIIIPKDDTDAKGLFHLSILSSVFFSFLTFIFFTVLQILDIQLFHTESSMIIIAFLSLAVLFQSILLSLRFWANRIQKYKYLMWFPVISSFTTITINILFALTGMTDTGLILGNVLGFIVAVIYLSTRTSPKKWILSVDKLKLLFSKYSRFPKFQAPAILLFTISLQIPVILLSLFFDTRVTGLYSFGHRVLQMPMFLVGMAVTQVYYKQISDKVNNGESITDITKSVMKKIFLVVFLPMTLIIGFGDKIFSFVFGAKWNEAGLFASLLAPWMLMVFVATPFNNILVVLKKQKQNMYMNIIILFTTTATIVCGALILKNYLYTIILLGIVGFALWYCVCLYVSLQAKIKLKEYIVQTILYFIILIIPVLILRYFIFGFN
jgi:lipopolysaccharide exporter